ncbi:MAG: NUDIX hydrolase [Saprospiraceae bacterium]
MYEIYINETPLILIQNDELGTDSLDTTKNLLIRYNGKPRSLMSPIDMLEKTQRLDSIIIYHHDVTQLKADFESLYKILAAGGGVVVNEKGEILTMYRRGSWDLPKGKIDKGETKEAAAIREVQEETGLNVVELGDFLLETNHTYKNRKGKRVIKRTYWYKMTTKETLLKPEIEEDIELCEWMPVKEFLQKKPLYNTIRVVIDAYLG